MDPLPTSLSPHVEHLSTGNSNAFSSAPHEGSTQNFSQAEQPEEPTDDVVLDLSAIGWPAEEWYQGTGNSNAFSSVPHEGSTQDFSQAEKPDEPTDDVVLDLSATGWAVKEWYQGTDDIAVEGWEEETDDVNWTASAGGSAAREGGRETDDVVLDVSASSMVAIERNLETERRITPDTAPLVGNGNSDPSSGHLPSGTTAPIGKEEGRSYLPQDEAVWWTGRGKRSVQDEDGDESSEEDGTDGEGYEEAEEEDELRGGEIIYIPSAGAQVIGIAWARYLGATVDVIEEAEVIVGEDETLEGILAAMTL